MVDNIAGSQNNKKLIFAFSSVDVFLSESSCGHASNAAKAFKSLCDTLHSHENEISSLSAVTSRLIIFEH